MALSSDKHPNMPATLARLSFTKEDGHERLARKAYELYQQRGEEPGHDLDDWLLAERLVAEEWRHHPPIPDPILAEEPTTEDDRVPP
jgi:Protein of unknown function (DUF2934)